MPNRSTAEGCTVNDLVLDERTWDTYGAFVRHVENVTTQLVADGVLDRRDRGAVIRAAASGEVGR
ncbi:hypothetical protein CLV30_112143 [Haloactinopolyspora alba]|uniref:Uncharacterized protein n=1 Tax=Haloactinopolyspora alba TaxID=648780 RepID=A0A2P8DXF1_9ACTN|nr:hypothetical protein CLV30_112143 [Haloactinopolyspora alba]